MSGNILEGLAAKRALDELIYRQALAVDKRDWATYRACFEEDIDFDLSDHTDRIFGKGFGLFNKRDQWVDLVIQAVSGFDCTQHILSNACHQVNGDRAETQCHVLAEHFLNNDSGDRSISVGGIYIFGSVHSEVGWRIKAWRMKVLWYRGNTNLYKLAGEKSQNRR